MTPPPPLSPSERRAFNTMVENDLEDAKETIAALRAENQQLRAALMQYKQGNEHAAKNELIEASAHYDEADQLLAKIAL